MLQIKRIIYVSIYLYFYPSIYPSICLSIYPFIHLHNPGLQRFLDTPCKSSTIFHHPGASGIRRPPGQTQRQASSVLRHGTGAVTEKTQNLRKTWCHEWSHRSGCLISGFKVDKCFFFSSHVVVTCISFSHQHEWVRTCLWTKSRSEGKSLVSHTYMSKVPSNVVPHWGMIHHFARPKIWNTYCHWWLLLLLLLLCQWFRMSPSFHIHEQI